MGIFSTSSSKSRMEFVVIDTGSDIFNRIIDAFLVFAIVAAVRVLAWDAYHWFTKGSFSKDKLKPLLTKMCKEGAYWGIIVGLYVGMEYGIKMTHIAGTWKSAMLGGVLTGALVSSACNNSRDKVVEDAITGGAIGTAAEFLQYLT